MKKRKLLYVILIIIFLSLFVYFVNSKTFLNLSQNIKVLMYGEPIDLETGIVNNKFFYIDTNDAAKGINDAIEYASKNNIQYIKLEKNIYNINSSIYLKSNLHLDLNGSTIEYLPNGKKLYYLFVIDNLNNVKISNGLLVGDRYEHDYTTDNSTHEWGMGVEISSATNVEIFNLDISKMTGDGIYITQKGSTSENLINSFNINIFNCRIHDNRRQGITIISGENINIYSNEIFNINGVNPKSAICVESNYSYEKSDNINIYDNKLYNLNGNYSIYYYRNLFNSKIYNNEISGQLFIHDVKGNLQIFDNLMNNASVICSVTERENENGFMINKVIINNNTMKNSNISLKNCEKAIIENNIVYNREIVIKESEAAIINNKVINELETLQYAFIYGDDGGNYCTIYKQGNTMMGNINFLEKVYPNVQIKEEIESFLEKF